MTDTSIVRGIPRRRVEDWANALEQRPAAARSPLSDPDVPLETLAPAEPRAS